MLKTKVFNKANYFEKLEVKKLSLKSSSAGNFLNKDTSETLRNELNRTPKPVSVHVPKHLKPSNDKDFGYYLAGLIDGNSLINSKSEIIIFFSDISLAYFVKKKIGFGKVKAPRALTGNALLQNGLDQNVQLVIAHPSGIIRVINLISDKLVLKDKILSFSALQKSLSLNIDISGAYSSSCVMQSASVSVNTSASNKSLFLKNHWLAGFCDALSTLASFKINIDNIESRSVSLNFIILHKHEYVLNIFKSIFGGYIGNNTDTVNTDTGTVTDTSTITNTNTNTDTENNLYYYNSASLDSARKLINYFDYFHLNSSKHVKYLK